MTTETRKRRNYTEDFKSDAVALVTEQGYKTSEAARSLGIGDNLIRRWKREFEEGDQCPDQAGSQAAERTLQVAYLGSRQRDGRSQTLHPGH